MSRPPRARRDRRERERALRKQVRQTATAATKLPGGSPEQPLDVPSASVIEVQARSTPCVQCGGTLELRGDRATSTPRGLLREVTLVCRLCHTSRTMWFRIAPTAAN